MNTADSHLKARLVRRATRMWRRACFPGVAVALVALPVSVGLAQPVSESAADPFTVLSRRNIFDPERRPFRQEESRREQEAAVRPRVEQIRLNGTMLHSDRAYAFFSGADSVRAGVRPVGERIGELTVLEISATGVVLLGANNRVALRVGQVLVREGTNSWTVAGGSNAGLLSSAQPEPSSEERRTAATAPDESGTAESQNDLLREMMERRQKELSQ